jgi:hypothetical protein
MGNRRRDFERHHMAFLTLARIGGDPATLAAAYTRTSAVMDGVGRDHGLLLHAAASTPDGLLMVNLWPAESGSHAAVLDPRRLGVIRTHGLDPRQIRKEHHHVLRYVLFGDPCGRRARSPHATRIGPAQDLHARPRPFCSVMDALRPEQPIITAIDARARLVRLEAERAAAARTHDDERSARLHDDVEACRVQFVGLALAEIASFRAQLSGPQVG